MIVLRYSRLQRMAGLNPVEIVKSGDQFPRDFNITESDDYLVCAHQEGNYEITVLKRDTNTGKLTPQIINKLHLKVYMLVLFK